jgi:putative transposase
VRRQCELLGLSRASLYYEAAPETGENLRLMRLIDGQYTACPFYGSRRITAWLVSQGEAVNRKRVQRLLRLMGLEAIYPKPRLSANRNHKVYPYLLRNAGKQPPKPCSARGASLARRRTSARLAAVEMSGAGRGSTGVWLLLRRTQAQFRANIPG